MILALQHLETLIKILTLNFHLYKPPTSLPPIHKTKPAKGWFILVEDFFWSFSWCVKIVTKKHCSHYIINSIQLESTKCNSLQLLHFHGCVLYLYAFLKAQFKEKWLTNLTLAVGILFPFLLLKMFWLFFYLVMLSLTAWPVTKKTLTCYFSAPCYRLDLPYRCIVLYSICATTSSSNCL